MTRRTRYIAGLREYRERGLHMLHGQGGYGFIKLPLPWGLSDAIDYYLIAHGHTRPT